VFAFNLSVDWHSAKAAIAHRRIIDRARGLNFFASAFEVELAKNRYPRN
jgi:hypothetical protein